MQVALQTDLLRYFWIAPALAGLQVLWLPKAIRARASADPAFSAADRAIRWRVYAWLCAPFLALGLGLTFGSVTLLSYLRPLEGNPWVEVFFAVILAWLAVLGYSIFVKDGTRLLVEHQVLPQRGIPASESASRTAIKFFAAMTLLLVIAAFTALCVLDVPGLVGLRQ
jgi:hypothetical protein